MHDCAEVFVLLGLWRSKSGADYVPNVEGVFGSEARALDAVMELLAQDPERTYAPDSYELRMYMVNTLNGELDQEVVWKSGSYVEPPSFEEQIIGCFGFNPMEQG